MRKSLMLIPPAQAEALYDAALEDVPRGRRDASAMPGWPSAEEWAEDDLLLPPTPQAAAGAQDRHSSSRSSR